MNSPQVGLYCIDSSSLIRAWTRIYRPAFAKTFWANLSASISMGEVVAPDEVKREISAKGDGLKEWAGLQAAAFVAIDEDQQRRVTKILARYPYIAKKHKQAHHADPWVIALAQQTGATAVTEEEFGSVGKPGIPRVCADLGIKCITLADMIEALGWEF